MVMSTGDSRITNLMSSRLRPLYVLLHIRLGNTVTLGIDWIMDESKKSCHSLGAVLEFGYDKDVTVMDFLDFPAYKVHGNPVNSNSLPCFQEMKRREDINVLKGTELTPSWLSWLERRSHRNMSNQMIT